MYNLACIILRHHSNGLITLYWSSNVLSEMGWAKNSEELYFPKFILYLTIFDILLKYFRFYNMMKITESDGLHTDLNFTYKPQEMQHWPSITFLLESFENGIIKSWLHSHPCSWFDHTGNIAWSLSLILQNEPEIIEQQVASVASALPGATPPRAASAAASPSPAKSSPQTMQELEDSITAYIEEEKVLPVSFITLFKHFAPSALACPSLDFRRCLLHSRYKGLWKWLIHLMPRKIVKSCARLWKDLVSSLL